MFLLAIHKSFFSRHSLSNVLPIPTHLSSIRVHSTICWIISVLTPERTSSHTARLNAKLAVSVPFVPRKGGFPVDFAA